MNTDAVLESIQSRIRDSEQQKRIKSLAERVQKAFAAARTRGVQEELTNDWTALKKEFDEALRIVQRETGLY